LENLLNNAVKYGNGEIVKITAQQTRGRMMLSVHNEGNPIPETGTTAFLNTCAARRARFRRWAGA
jgi:signal transduction histidine kinase